jgi:CO/xanthine dehydrogenase FAD-binding subunit
MPVRLHLPVMVWPLSRLSVNSKKIVPIEDMITGPEKNILQPGELIVGFHLDTISERSAQLFLKVGRRQAVAVSRLNVSVILDEKLADPRIVLGSCFPSPRRLRDVETLISRKGLSREICVKAGLTAADEFINVCGLRSSAAYKLPAIREVVSKALRQSYKALENLK